MAVFDAIDAADIDIRDILEQAVERATKSIDELVELAPNEPRAALKLSQQAKYLSDINGILKESFNTSASIIDDTLTDELREILKELGVKPSELVGTDIKQFQELADSTKRSFLSYNDVAITAQKEAIGKLLTGQWTHGEAVQMLQGSLRLTMAQARTVVTQNMAAMSRNMNVTLAANMGVDTFRYVGPNDSLTRDWCQETLDTNGGVYTLVEISKMENDAGPNPPIYHGGGYNCRHRFVPVVA